MGYDSADSSLFKRGKDSQSLQTALLVEMVLRVCRVAADGWGGGCQEIGALFSHKYQNTCIILSVLEILYVPEMLIVQGCWGG